MLVLKSLGFRKLGHSSEMRNDALKHREGLKGFDSSRNSLRIRRQMNLHTKTSAREILVIQISRFTITRLLSQKLNKVHSCI